MPTYLGSAVYAAAVLADTPSLYWRLGEPSGTNANDETANNRDGTYTGTFTLAQTGALKGDTNTAVDLTAPTGVVTSTYNPFVNGTTRTFEGWAYRDTDARRRLSFSAAIADLRRGYLATRIAAAADVYLPIERLPAAWRLGPPLGRELVSGFTGRWSSTRPTDAAELYINGRQSGTQAAADAY